MASLLALSSYRNLTSVAPASSAFWTSSLSTANPSVYWSSNRLSRVVIFSYWPNASIDDSKGSNTVLDEEVEADAGLERADDRFISFLSINFKFPTWISNYKELYNYSHFFAT